KGSALFWRWLVVMVLVLVPLALAVLPNLSALLHPVYVEQPKGPPTLQTPRPGAFAFLFLAVVLGGLALVWYRIEAFRYLAARVRLAAIQLHSSAKGMSGVGQVLLYCLGLIGLVVVMGVAFAVLSLAAQPIVKGAIAAKTLTPLTIVMVSVA